MISYRRNVVRQIANQPHNPSLYIQLSGADHKLGFCDIGAGNAYRALTLIKAGLDIDKHLNPTDLYLCVFHHFGQMRIPPSKIIYALRDLYRKALTELLHNLLGSAALWDGLIQGREALKQFPHEADLKQSMLYLKETFENGCRSIQKLYENAENTQDIQEAVSYSRRGRIYQKPYPWLSQKLYTRTLALVREVNKAFSGSPCEVKCVKFGGQASHIMSEDEDVGPLGIFATRDIREGELLMVDESLGACVSDVPSSFLTHCDACHGTIAKPYMYPGDIIKPACCRKVAYCSVACHESASNGYHRVLCGKNIDWLYQDAKGTYSKKAARDNSRAILFARIMSIVLADRQAEKAVGKAPTHPLLHPLIARMTANYNSRTWFHPEHCSTWGYSENVVTPHRILQLLGVDVFTMLEFTPEVIQTIYWRLENNVSRCIIYSPSLRDPKESTATLPKRHQDDDELEHLLCLNSRYLFFNHSCKPNVDWHGANANPWEGISYLTGFNGKVFKPGCGAVWCIASEDVKAGEELKISYVGNPLGCDSDDRKAKRCMLNKWFDSGCGCTACKQENEAGATENEENEDGNEGDN